MRALSPRLATALCYIFTLGLGLAMVAALFPPEFLLPRAGMGWAPQGDAAQHAIAQRVPYLPGGLDHVCLQR